MRKVNGSRVEELKVKECAGCKEYQDLDEYAIYPVVMSSYIVKGGDGFNMIKYYQNISYKLSKTSTKQSFNSLW